MAADGSPRLTALAVAGGGGPWEAAGFRVGDGHVQVGSVRLRFDDGRSPGTGILAWTLTDVEDGLIDGLLTLGDASSSDAESPRHPNGATLIDHLVVTTSDLARTTAALEAFAIRARRTRDAGRMRQRFFRLGEVILEVVGPPEATDPSPAAKPQRAGNPDPARFWGLALTVTDIDATAALLGEGLGPITDAVQKGRRIATLRHEALGIPVPLAFMSPAPRP